MKKDKLGEGLEALFGGSSRQDPQADDQPTTEAQAQAAPAPMGVFDTIQDKELREAIVERRKTKRGRPRKNENPTGESCADGYTRYTAIMSCEKLAKLREIAKREGLTVKDVFEAMMDLAIDNYEAKHGIINIYPDDERGDTSRLFKL